jgi:hypothetical protein
MRNLFRRVSALEARKRLNFPQRMIVRYQNERDPRPEIPEDECDENTLLVIVEYAKAPLPDGATESAR